MHDYDSGYDWGRQRSSSQRSRQAADPVVRATVARADQWSSDRTIDPGDTHDKGELSLCVGEAA